MKTRFDLEQEIMECWNITSDLEDVYRYVLEGEPNMDTTQRDKVANILLGLAQLYDLKFNKTFDTFTQCVKTKQFKVEEFE